MASQSGKCELFLEGSGTGQSGMLFPSLHWTGSQPANSIKCTAAVTPSGPLAFYMSSDGTNRCHCRRYVFNPRPSNTDRTCDRVALDTNTRTPCADASTASASPPPPAKLCAYSHIKHEGKMTAAGRRQQHDSTRVAGRRGKRSYAYRWRVEMWCPVGQKPAPLPVPASVDE